MKSASIDRAKFTNPFAMAIRPWLDRITHGRLRLTLPSGDVWVVGEGQEAAMELHSWKGLRRILLQGAIGFADGYIAGEWSTPDLVELLRFCAANSDNLQGISGGPLHRLFNRLRHKFRRNSKRGSRKNIMSHYDLGNDFFRLWLDPTMLYSSALYETGDETLETAQQTRLNRILSLLQLNPGDNVLEIGCGWGELARRMAQTEAKVVGLTISPSQLEAAQAKCESLSADLRLQDYRDVEGQFDHVVSIEMIEAVGEAYWPTYFGKIAQVLKPGGTAGVIVAGLILAVLCGLLFLKSRQAPVDPENVNDDWDPEKNVLTTPSTLAA